MMDDVPALLDKHAGKYEKLWRALQKKYVWKDVAPSVAQQAMVDALQNDKGVAGLMWRIPAARIPAPTQEQL